MGADTFGFWFSSRFAVAAVLQQIQSGNARSRLLRPPLLFKCCGSVADYIREPCHRRFGSECLFDNVDALWDCPCKTKEVKVDDRVIHNDTEHYGLGTITGVRDDTDKKTKHYMMQFDNGKHEE